MVGITDPPCPETAAIAETHRTGIRVLLIAGDHPRTAQRLAATVRDSAVFARVSPRHELRIVDALQTGGSIVAMTGDGVNDAPAMKSADIGVTMGTGIEVARQAAAMILADGNTATIVEAVRNGRAVFGNIRQSPRYLLSSNMNEVLAVFFGVVGAGVIGLAGSGEAVVVPLFTTQIL